jgi:hypothetical protein
MEQEIVKLPLEQVLAARGAIRRQGLGRLDEPGCPHEANGSDELLFREARLAALKKLGEGARPGKRGKDGSERGPQHGAPEWRRG